MGEAKESDEIAQRLRDAHHFRFTGDPYGMEAPSLYTEAADEIERLRAELRRFQRIVIDSSEGTADCEDLCMVLCAGPCQGINVPARSSSQEEASDGR